jgi:hypothetical protein
MRKGEYSQDTQLGAVRRQLRGDAIVNATIGSLLALSFLVSVLGLFLFIWALTHGLMRAGPDAAQIIFEEGEVGVVEEPAGSSKQRDALQDIERKSVYSVLGFHSTGLAAVFFRRRVDHLYVSVWDIAAALLWFTILYVVAKIPYTHFGVEQATVNWWYAHNVLGFWLTPLGLGAAYYFIAKMSARPSVAHWAGGDELKAQQK